MALVRIAIIVTMLGCSPEASRARDGSAGADIGNKRVTRQALADPQPADTTMMPGRAPAPVDRFAPPPAKR
ncbi:MAG: hypothetical protein AB1762_13265 [Gemmatimonadota bacterium]